MGVTKGLSGNTQHCMSEDFRTAHWSYGEAPQGRTLPLQYKCKCVTGPKKYNGADSTAVARR